MPRSVVSVLAGVVALCVCLPIEFSFYRLSYSNSTLPPRYISSSRFPMIGIVLIFYGFLGLEFVKGGPFIGAMILIAWGSAAIIESYIQLQMCMSLPLVSCPAYNPGLFLLIVAGGFILIGIYAIVCEADTDWDHKIALNYLRLSYCARVILLMRVGSSYLVRRIKPV